MKLNRIFAALILVAATATVASAQGQVDIAWTSCIGPVDIAVTGGNGTTAVAADAYISVLGQSQVSQAYQNNTYAGSPGGIQDAWRFDATGCNAGYAVVDNTGATKTCPLFSGTVPGLIIPKYEYDSTTGKVRILFASAYPALDANGNPTGNPAATNPAQRYFLDRFHFDLTYATTGPTDVNAGTCGGAGVPVCFALTQASWLDLTGVEIQWGINRSYITTNDPNNLQHCPTPVPAAARTWGSVKNQYR